jgi:hypothetical protein
MAKKVKLNEARLHKIIKESIRNVINESFGNPELAELVQDCGGLVRNPRYPDARNMNGFDIRYAKPTGYMDRNAVSQMQQCLNCFNADIASSLLYTNDGGAIGVEDGHMDYPAGKDAWQSEVDSPYATKMYQRGKKFTKKNPESSRWHEKWSELEDWMRPGVYRNEVSRERTQTHQKAQVKSRKNKR